MRNICACGSTTWSTLTDCFVCGTRTCNECGEQYGAFQVVCAACISNASEVLEAIRPEFYDVLLEMQEHHLGTIPEEPISIELYRLIVNCKSVAEVVKVFEAEGRKTAPAWQERKAA